MLYGLYLSASGMISSAYKQDVVANNLANSESVGFKRDVASFEERLTEAQQQRLPGRSNAMLEMLGGGILARPTLVDTRQGEIEHTGNALDVAIEGDGYFAVSTKQGESRLTRNGQFVVNKDGKLVLANGEGQSVLDPKGQPIRLLPNLPVTIGQDGTISVTTAGSATPTTAGSIQLVNFVNPAGLQALGENLFQETAASGTPNEGKAGDGAFGKFKQGALEGSNVQVVEEMVDMIAAQRTYEMNTKVLSAADNMLQ